MQPNQNENTGNATQPRQGTERDTSSTWLVTGAMLAGLAGIGFGFYSYDQASRIAGAQKSSMESVSDMQQQLKSMRQQMAEREREIAAMLAAAEQRAAVPQEQTAATAPVRTKAASAQPAARKKAAKPPAEDPRVSRLEKLVSDQDQKLADTRRSVDAARSDLEGRISSASAELNGALARSSDELKGSIARTSDEVAALRRRGERDYFEFSIPKSKVSQRIGPVGLTLRKADVKKKRYNIELLVDDNKLEKKSVNLFEPVYVTAPDWHQPLELVVNQVTKDRVAGYVSVPKYKRAEVASTGGDRQKLAVPENGRQPE